MVKIRLNHVNGISSLLQVAQKCSTPYINYFFRKLHKIMCVHIPFITRAIQNDF